MAEAPTISLCLTPLLVKFFLLALPSKLYGFKPSSNLKGLSLALDLPFRANQEQYSEFTNWLQITLAESSMQILNNQYFDFILKLKVTAVCHECTILMRMLPALKA